MYSGRDLGSEEWDIIITVSNYDIRWDDDYEIEYEYVEEQPEDEDTWFDHWVDTESLVSFLTWYDDNLWAVMMEDLRPNDKLHIKVSLNAYTAWYGCGEEYDEDGEWELIEIINRTCSDEEFKAMKLAYHTLRTDED